MPPGVKSLLALVAAAGMVGGAIVARSALDEKEVNDAIVVRLTCDPAVADACQAAGVADPRIEVTVEPLATTRSRLRSLESGKDPGLDAWVTIGPWMAMVDGGRSGQPPLGRSTGPVVSSAVTLVQRTDVASCAPTPLACADRVRNIGLQPPPSDGVGLAGAAFLVARAGAISLADLDLAALTSGPAAGPLRQLKQAAKSVGLGVVNGNFAEAQVVVTTEAAAKVVPAAARATKTPLDVRAVVETSILSDDAAVPLAADAPGGKALHDALVAVGWDATPQPSGLPDADVLAALQDVWGSG